MPMTPRSGRQDHAGLTGRFLRGLAVNPRGTAVRSPDWSLSYEELHERALTWAGALLRATDAPLEAVGVLAGKGPESYAGILAGLYAGATVVPLNTDTPAARTGQMLRDAGVSAVVADEQGRALLAQAPGDIPALPLLAADGGTVPVDTAHALAEPRTPATEGTAYVLFTSGSTGRPKGVRIPHAGTSHYFELLDKRYDFTPEDVFSQTFDLNFDCAMFDLFSAWGAGGTVQLIPGPAYRELPAFAAEHRLTVWFSTPSAISLLRRMGDLRPGALPGLRWSLFAGEALRCADAEEWQRAAPASTVENLYGPTELTITICAYRWSTQTTPALAVHGIVPIGEVHEGHDRLLLDAAGQQVSGVGAEGELLIAGPQLTPGYLDPADGRGRFVERGGRTWYRTGDRVREVADGVLVYVDRLDAQVQVQGVRIEPAEIDQALRALPGIVEAVTVAVPAPEGDTALVGFYTGEAQPQAVLARSLRGALPERMVPRRFAHVPEMPLNANRKTDRAALRARATRLLGG
ncbi:amino acid adenylation domain-containing protein [Streptomyces zhaozhouensis]|uniref:Amino acid adenylation domain-containing protein n=1 Tax=Streptomyces zhaozhouensis TaxID=1300267 RepID=A0A286E7L8_9ACTN|nr:AMP-binding protein [Streptomyces zhaozhouensis]SOD66880.1 amino acid adenylation domain-containing protein [Streptomyces zhaozhouensis]